MNQPNVPASREFEYRLAQQIFSILFKSAISAEMVERYLRATAYLNTAYSSTDLDRFEKQIATIHTSSSLEALEIASRLKKKVPLLTSRFRLMVYLGECEPSLRPQLVNNENRPIFAFFILALATLRSVAFFIYGIFILEKWERL